MASISSPTRKEDVTIDQVADRAQAQLAQALTKLGDDVITTTPSVKAGRRYLGVTVDGKEYVIVLEVEEV